MDLVTTRRRWEDLSPRTRRLVVAGALLDGGLRIAALVDLRRRPADQVRGSTKAWAVGVSLVSSAGVLPLVYFLAGRRTGR